MSHCLDCPRHCLAQRTPQSPGFCGVCAPSGVFRVARIMAHPFEEPFISGQHGSGTVFFTGCALRCVFCQNEAISRHGVGQDIDQDTLVEAIREMVRQGVHNVNLVTASHYVRDMPGLIDHLKRDGCSVPIVWNSSAYESVDALRRLSGLVDIYLPDFKFHDSDLSQRLAGASDYRPVAVEAIREMVRQQPQPVFDENGLMKRGVAVRHLVLPGQWRDSLKVIDELSRILPLDTPLSIMSQYTPPGKGQTALGEAKLDETLTQSLRRRITTYEYRKVVDHALTRGFTRILTQDRTSAISAYTPDFISERIGR